MIVHVTNRRIHTRTIHDKGSPNWGQGSSRLYSTCKEAIMEDFIPDEVESILYIAREISGMPHALPHDELA